MSTKNTQAFPETPVPTYDSHEEEPAVPYCYSFHTPEDPFLEHMVEWDILALTLFTIRSRQYGQTPHAGSSHLLQAAREAAAAAAPRPHQLDDLLVHVVLDLQVEAAQRAVHVADAAVGVLQRLVDGLAHDVLDLILVVGLKTAEDWTTAGKGWGWGEKMWK